MLTERRCLLWCLALLGLASSAVSRASDTRGGLAQTQNQPTGFAIGWNERDGSSIPGREFRRANPTRPFADASIFYNDEAGIRAMTSAIPRRTRPRLFGATDRLLAVELRDQSGRLLPGLAMGNSWFVVGQPGGRYSITVRNRSVARMEFVLSIDGRNVADGRPVSRGKGGYIVRPDGSVRIEGFRRSTDPAAAFRFSSLRDFNANRKPAKTRAAGTIRIAVFNEFGTDPDSLAKRSFGFSPIRFLSVLGLHPNPSLTGRLAGRSVRRLAVALWRSANAEILHQNLRLSDE